MATYEELYERAQELDIDGRSTMDKDELEVAIAEAEGSSDGETVVAVVDDRTEARINTKPAPRATPTSVPDDDDTPKVVNPNYEADENGYQGVDPIYAQAASHVDRPAVDESVPGAPGDDED